MRAGMEDEMIVAEFTNEEVKVIARITGNLMAAAFDADADPDLLESIYYKTSQHLTEEEAF